MLAQLQERCQEVQAALLPPTILMAEEVALADQISALAFVFSAGIVGPGGEQKRQAPRHRTPVELLTEGFTLQGEAFRALHPPEGPSRF